MYGNDAVDAVEAPPAVEEPVPSWAKDIIAAMKSVKPPPRKPNGPSTERRARGEKPKDKQNFPIRPPGFSFNGCWHCGSTEHTRSGGRDGKCAKCRGFTGVMKKANPGVTDRKKMKLPATYQGAYEKAPIAADTSRGG